MHLRLSVRSIYFNFNRLSCQNYFFQSVWGVYIILVLHYYQTTTVRNYEDLFLHSFCLEVYNQTEKKKNYNYFKALCRNCRNCP